MTTIQGPQWRTTILEPPSVDELARGSLEFPGLFCALRMEPSEMPRFVDTLLKFVFVLLALMGLIVILERW